MTPADVTFSCTCGRVHGTVHDVAPNRGNHVKCYCRSCQTSARVLHCEESLDGMGGTSIYQTIPSKVSFDGGLDHLACLRLSPKGLLRWYASCCDAPLFTMPNASWFAIAGLNMARIAEKDRPLFGDIVAVHQAQQAINATPGLRDFGLKRAGLRVFWARAKGEIAR